ncbi:hypothetical protein L3V82_02320 [Thiotrichales bacterium 19S3-7]|nr:hypothetical protein [Thiotrichales bacterium 19S3-7]MCF6801002.1 hypothetical protein [Thiotrichales bacterium 19S3-11]
MTPREFNNLFITVLSMMQTLEKANANSNLALLNQLIQRDLVRFLDHLNTVITDSYFLSDHIQQPNIDYLKRNIDDFYEEDVNRQCVGRLNFEAIIYFEVVLSCIFKFNHPQLERFISEFMNKLVTGFPEDERLNLQLKALHKIKHEFHLDVDLIKPIDFLHELRNIQSQQLELEQKISFIDSDELAISMLKTQREQRFNLQKQILESIAYLYCHGSNQFSDYSGIKKHNQKDVERIFGQYLDYNYGIPRLKPKYQLDNFNFQNALTTIFNACINYYNRFSSRQCGSIADSLCAEVNQYKAELKMEVLSGNAREGIVYTYALEADTLKHEYQNRLALFRASGKLEEREMLKMSIQTLQQTPRNLILQVQINVSEAYQTPLDEHQKPNLAIQTIKDEIQPVKSGDQVKLPQLSFLELSIERISQQIKNTTLNK